MIKRVLEPEVMDSPEETAAYDAMDHREVNRLFVDDLMTLDDFEGDILDLGTGTARIPIELCNRHETTRIMAVDMSISMLDVARINIELAGYAERIQLDLIDAKKLPFDDEQFDIVMSNSIVHHIPEPFVCLSEAVRVAASGGYLFFRDLIRPAAEQTVQQLVKAYAGDEDDHARKMFADSLRAALTVDEVRSLVQSLGFSMSTVQATSDRHWTWMARKSNRSCT